MTGQTDDRRDFSVLYNDPKYTQGQILKAFNAAGVLRYLKDADRAVSKEDLLQECYLYLLSLKDKYKPELATIGDYIYWKSSLWFTSYFRHLARRRRSRVDHVAKTTPGRKGVVRYGELYETPPDVPIGDDDTKSVTAALDNQQDALIHRKLGREPDPRPSHEMVIDLYDLIDQLPDGLSKPMLMLLDGKSPDMIAYLLDVSSDTIHNQIKEAREWLTARMK